MINPYKTYNFESEKNKAKSIDIASLYFGELKLVGAHLRGFCPFHFDTKTPNFYIYPETNSWYCFAGCGGGDAISFYMRLKDVDFKQAIREMLNV